jgi:hypothetical protein
MCSELVLLLVIIIGLSKMFGPLRDNDEMRMSNDKGMTKKRQIATGKQGAAVSSPPRRSGDCLSLCEAFGQTLGLA